LKFVESLLGSLFKYHFVLFNWIDKIHLYKMMQAAGRRIAFDKFFMPPVLRWKI